MTEHSENHSPNDRHDRHILTAALLADLTAAGLTLALDPPDTLLLRGDPATRVGFIPRVRTLKADLVALLSEPRRLWLIRHPDGHFESHSFCPPATLTEVRGWYPDALSIEPEEPEACP